MSWAKPAMSTRSGSQPNPIAIPRPIWATSSEWVSRVRGCPFPRPDHLCLVGESAQCGAVQNPGAIPGEVAAALALGTRQARGLRRFGHHPLAVEIVVGVLLVVEAIAAARGAAQCTTIALGPARSGLHCRA